MTGAASRRPVLSPARVHAILLVAALAFFLPGQASLPPTDRDESRFVQATRQMLESGDFVDIRFQGEARHKKPVGIHWLQAAAVSLFGGPDAAPLWAYRLPSLLGAAAAVLVAGHVGLVLFGPAAGLAAGLLLASTLLLNVEARLAKTDAVLLAAVVLAQAVLARLWLARTAPEPLSGASLSRPLAALFWAAVALGILVKGPIIVLVCGLTALALALVGRGAGWLRALRPLSGLLIAALIVLPWFVLITIESGGAFFQGSLGHDLWLKVVSGQEGKGFPPGYYVVAMAATFWPATLLLLPALAWAWRRRSDPAVQFCLAWIVPSWAVFEAVPTKLFHYVLPTYPAVAILVAAALLDGAAAVHRRLALAGAAIWLSVGVALAVLAGGLLPAVEGRFDLLAALVALGAAALVGLAGWRLVEHARSREAPGDTEARPILPVAAASAAAFLLFALVFAHVLPGLSTVWIGPRLAAAAAAHRPCPSTVLASAGFHEPSLVFLAGTATVLTFGEGAARHLLADPACALAAVERRERPDFDRALARAGRSAAVLAEVSGFNYSKGDPLTIALVRLR